MLSSDYDAELVLWLLDCLWGVCYFISGYMLHISLRRLIASAEKMAPHQTRNVLVDKCLGFRCWTYQPPLHKFLQDMCWTPAPVLNCTHGGLNFQHKALCMLHSWGNLCSFAEMVSNNKENSKLAMTCVQYFLYVRWRQRDGRDVYRYTGFSAYPQGGFHQHPCVYTSTVTSFASSGPVLINVCVREMSTQTWFTFAELKVDLDLGQCSCSLVPTAKLKCGVLLSGSSLASCSDMNFHWTFSAASENDFMKRWDWWIA